MDHADSIIDEKCSSSGGFHSSMSVLLFWCKNTCPELIYRLTIFTATQKGCFVMKYAYPPLHSHWSFWVSHHQTSTDTNREGETIIIPSSLFEKALQHEAAWTSAVVLCDFAKWGSLWVMPGLIQAGFESLRQRQKRQEGWGSAASGAQCQSVVECLWYVFEFFHK